MPFDQLSDGYLMHKVRIIESSCPNHWGKTTVIVVYDFNMIEISIAY
jgi:hypothetical protein